jgi:hypothetical protein
MPPEEEGDGAAGLLLKNTIRLGTGPEGGEIGSVAGMPLPDDEARVKLRGFEAGGCAARRAQAEWDLEGGGGLGCLEPDCGCGLVSWWEYVKSHDVNRAETGSVFSAPPHP